MSKKKKYGKVKVASKPVWEQAKGHYDFRGNTTFDNRPKRKRTRGAAKQAAMRDYD